MEVEDPLVNGKLVRSFIRARIVINIQQPLSMGCWIPRRNMPKVWVSLKYERLQDLCFKCGIIGHEQKKCAKARVMSSLGNNIQRYSHRVGVPPAKPIKMIREEQERRRNQAHGGASQSSESSTQQQSRGENNRQEEVTKEVQLNKERVEYKRMLESQEGDGSMPAGWHETGPDESSSPIMGRNHQSCNWPISNLTPLENLHLKVIPGFKGVLGEDELATFRIPTFCPENESIGPTLSDSDQNRQEPRGIEKEVVVEEAESQRVQDTKQVHMDKIAAYDKIQAGVQALRAEIQNHFPGNDQGECSQSGQNVYFESQGRKKGEERDRMDIFGMTKGVIGLGQSAIITEYPGNYINPIEYSSITLSQAEIDKCKVACTGIDPVEDKKGTSPRAAVDNQRSIERDSGSYLVEFPSDEDAEIGNNNYTL